MLQPQPEPLSAVVEPRLVEAPALLWRVGRAPEPLNFSTLNAADAQNPRGGNRFDVPGGGILYAASRPQGAFAETLARFRPSPAMRALPREPGEHFMEAGAVPADWRTRRYLTEFCLEAPLPFLDVDHPATHTFLMSTLENELTVLGYEELDVGSLRGKDRILTRLIAGWAYASADAEGTPHYSGIRYGSRLGDYECWAIFEGSRIARSTNNVIDKGNEQLLEVARDFSLSIH